MKRNIETQEGQIILYKNRLEVLLVEDTVWLTQKRMADLFNAERSVITKHIHNIFNSKELHKKSNVQKMHTAHSDKPVNFYSLNVIISVGYRVNSNRGIQFRIWATDILKKHLIKGYTVNEKRLKQVESNYKELRDAVALIGNVLDVRGLPIEAKGIIAVITEYARALDILDDFDHQRLTKPKGTKYLKYELTYDEAKMIIDTMKKKFNDSDIMGQEKDESFKSSIGAIYQTFDRKELYPTVEEKAAHLLYFITKNHSFVDGNKRIGAAIFIYFLEKNGLLHRKDIDCVIDNNALIALTLMIASSKPSEKDTMIKVILNILGKNEKTK
jgi:prophage maintenance system killer protein